MEPSFDKPGDSFQINCFGASARGKWIHSVAQIAKTSWVPKGNHPYTGIFKGGAKYGYVRLSSAVDPGTDFSQLTPGMGLKLLTDGQDSANLVSMYSLGGNPKGDTNFFSQDFTNHPPPPGKVS